MAREAKSAKAAKVAKPKRKTKTKETVKNYCRKCEKTIAENNFYQATNTMLDSNGLLSICKNCCVEIYDEFFSIHGSMEKAIYDTCQVLDIRFSREALVGTQSHVAKLASEGKQKGSIFGYYKSKLGSVVKTNTKSKDESLLFTFKYSDSLDQKYVGSYEEEVIDKDFELTRDVLDFWGASNKLDKADYKYLIDKFNEYIATYECETPVMEEYLKQAAFESLEIRHKRSKGEDCSKNLTNLSSILTNANIKPAQESGANATDQLAFGTLVKKWEDERPIPEPDPEWVDVDRIRKYVRVWFLGHLCKMLGMNNEYTKEYEEEMERLRVEVPLEDEEIEANFEDGEQ